MPDSLLFIRVAHHQGYSVGAAQATLGAVQARLADGGVAAQRYYIFRTGESGVGAGDGGSAEPSGRSRLLLAFQSADAALAFAQRNGLGASPRLIALSLGQALAAMIQRPAITTLLVAGEDASTDELSGALPAGVRIDRAALIELLAGVTS